MRKDKEYFDVLILPKDLKVFNKDKRDQMLLNYNPEEDEAALLEANEVEEEENEEELTNNGKVTQQSSEDVSGS